jgi:hypothetical protein
MPAENPCSQLVIEVRIFQIRRPIRVELISAPGGYGRIVWSGRHRMSRLDLAYRSPRTGLSSACQMVISSLAGSISLGVVVVEALA